MASVEYTENVTDDQLEALAGGEALRYQASAFGVTKNNKVYPIFVGLSQERQQNASDDLITLLSDFEIEVSLNQVTAFDN